MDLGVVRAQLQRWRKELPRVSPWYAVKCNPDINVLRELAAHGCGFDIASQAELKAVLSLEVPSEKIIYANPCKQVSHIVAASDSGVKLTTFDNVDEMHKIQKNMPGAKLVVRILGDDSSSVCRFNAKFGVAVEELAPILSEAKRIGAQIVGVSFHVGSGCRSADAFVNAVENARAAFDLFSQFGLPEPKFLDLGGGWPGALLGQEEKGEIAFEEIAAKLRPALERLFPADVKVIAEPGRYFVHSAATLSCCLTSRRAVFNTAASVAASGMVAVPAPPLESSASSADSSGSSGESEHEDADDEDEGDLVVDRRRTRRVQRSRDAKRARRAAAGDESLAASHDAASSSLLLPAPPGYRYYINDGCYASFNCIMYDHRVGVEPRVILDGATGTPLAGLGPLLDCSIWGSTCDGIDCISKSVPMPEVPLQSWFVFPNMGAYTSAACSTFNGFPVAQSIYLNASSVN